MKLPLKASVWCATRLLKAEEHACIQYMDMDMVGELEPLVHTGGSKTQAQRESRVRRDMRTPYGISEPK